MAHLESEEEQKLPPPATIKITKQTSLLVSSSREEKLKLAAGIDT